MFIKPLSFIAVLRVVLPFPDFKLSSSLIGMTMTVLVMLVGMLVRARVGRKGHVLIYFAISIPVTPMMLVHS